VKRRKLQGKALAAAMVADKHFRDGVERGLADVEAGRVSPVPDVIYREPQDIDGLGKLLSRGDQIEAIDLGPFAQYADDDTEEG